MAARMFFGKLILNSVTVYCMGENGISRFEVYNTISDGVYCTNGYTYITVNIEFAKLVMKSLLDAD